MPDALVNIHRAIAIDPMSVVAWHGLILLLINVGPLPAARDALNRLVEIDPRQEIKDGVATIALFEGHAGEALSTFQGEQLDFRYVGIAMAEHTLGHAAESQRALEILEQKYASVWAYQIAEVYAWRGETDKAFDWLERAYRQRDGGLTSIKYDRLLNSLREDPRYKALLRKLNLPET
jgi:tetratricopeptide (TPR) repeat protein